MIDTKELRKAGRAIYLATEKAVAKDLSDKLIGATNEIDRLQDKMDQIKAWINAYPLSMFPEPDFKKAARVLKENGMTLDSISASSMRHVLSGIKSIIDNR